MIMKKGARTGAPSSASRPQHSVILTDQQRDALSAVRAWLADPTARQVFRIFGYAGVGKTTIARELQREHPKVIYAAYTGKAVHVLRSKGCEPASTVHALIYIPAGQLYREELSHLRQQIADAIEAGATAVEIDVMHADERRLEALQGEMSWQINTEGPLAEDPGTLVVLDEVSMVGQEMAEDLLSFGCRVLVLGDPAQLPPIRGEGYFTDARPDIMLTEVHRQAGDSPILELATRVRVGVTPTPADRVNLTLDEMIAADQVLCGTNRTRWDLVARMRARMGRPWPVPVEGDRVICLRNNRRIGIFNGQQFTVVGMRYLMGRPAFGLQLIDDEGIEYEVETHSPTFVGQAESDQLIKSLPYSTDKALLTFANAITVHKAQGSEWGHVALVDESSVFGRRSAEDGQRWLYTGITRAAERLSLTGRPA